MQYRLNGLYKVLADKETVVHEYRASTYPSFGIRLVFIIYQCCDYGIFTSSNRVVLGSGQ